MSEGFNESPEAAKARRLRSIVTTIVRIKGHVADPGF